MPQLFTGISEARTKINEWKREGLSIGLVPTMGYLHKGHESLIERATKECDRVVVSIFVNPTQFGANEDLASYPRDLERDLDACARKGAHAVFAPSAEEMYEEGNSTKVIVEGLSEYLCGASRPVHFAGVCLVVCKLFNIVQADRAYFGEKDAQQLFIIKRMVRDLNIPIRIVGCPTVRESDGLAKSSRNSYLSPEERAAAPVIKQALDKGLAAVKAGQRDCAQVKALIKSTIDTQALARIDYVEIVSQKTLAPIERIDEPILCAAAVFFGKSRLIDNFCFDPNAQT